MEPKDTAVEIFVDDVKISQSARTNMAGNWSGVGFNLLTYSPNAPEGTVSTIYAKMGGNESNTVEVKLQKNPPHILKVTDVSFDRVIMDFKTATVPDGVGGSVTVYIDAMAGKYPRYTQWRPENRLNYTITTTNDEQYLFIKLVIEDVMSGRDYVMNAEYDPVKHYWAASSEAPGGVFTPERYYEEQGRVWDAWTDATQTLIASGGEKNLSNLVNGLKFFGNGTLLATNGVQGKIANAVGRVKLLADIVDPWLNGGDFEDEAINRMYSESERIERVRDFYFKLAADRNRKPDDDNDDYKPDREDSDYEPTGRMTPPVLRGAALRIISWRT